MLQNEKTFEINIWGLKIKCVNYPAWVVPIILIATIIILATIIML